MKKEKKTLEQVLINEKFIKEDQLKSAVREVKTSGKHLERVLADNRIIDDEGLARAKASVMGIPFIKLSQTELDRNVVRMISEKFAKQFRLIPVEFSGSILKIAMVSPRDLVAVNEVKLVAGCEIREMITTEKEMNQAINKYFKVEDVSRQALIDIRMEQMRTPETAEAEAEREKERVELEHLPSVKLVNDIINGALDRRASDIHFEPQDPEMMVRYRVDGVLYDIMHIPKQIEQSAISRLKIMANLNITESRRPQDGHITFKRGNRSYDFRMSTLRTVNGEKAVLRVLDREAMLLGLDKLGFTRDDESLFRSMVKKPFGMILVTGPTGSGKTTTLYAVLSQLDIRKANVITIENPVEYKLDGINQIQVDTDIGMTFARGLRTILRQDPDIILVGEIRDKETAEIAVHAALTGHLVFSTLHTNDAPSAITRLLDMGIEPFLISATVIGCVAQRLCRTVCPECNSEFEASDGDMKAIEQAAGKKQKERIILRKGTGCDFCLNTGFKGRESIFEIMNVSSAIRQRIISKASADEIRETAVQEGMRTLRYNGIQKVVDRVSTLEEIRRVVYIGGEVKEI